MIVNGVSSFVLVSAMAAMTGASFTGMTVKTKSVVSLNPPSSSTVTVTVTSPWKSNAGVMVSASLSTETATSPGLELTALYAGTFSSPGL